MRIKQVRLAQTIPGTASNLIDSDKFDLRFDGAKLHVKYKSGPNALKYGTFMVFPANIAYLEYEEVTELAPEDGQTGETSPQDPAKKGPGRPKK